MNESDHACATLSVDLAFGRFDSQSHRLTDHLPDKPNAVMWTGIDYSNPRIRDFRNVMQHTNPLVDRGTTPRMPWHDVHCVVYGQPARDLARHFVQSWNWVKAEKAKRKSEHIPFLLPLQDYTEREDEVGSEPLSLVVSREEETERGTCQVQVLRSAGDWSLGCPTESSIYNAYLTLIDRSKHFIYIENQFLITQSDTHNTSGLVKNRIGAALVERILRAHRAGRQFRVVVVMPLLPAFEAAVDSPEASSVRLIMQSQYASISKGPGSIIGQLQAGGIARPEDYISFFSLRTHDMLGERQVTEQLYIHSKLVIFDDSFAILGSANINDRSMLGMRDSEIALVVEDEDRVPVTLSTGEVLLAGRKVQELRMRLWQEHLGLLAEASDSPLIRSLADPLDDAVYHGLLRQQAARNTQIYRELFHCVPDDYVESWAEYALFTETLRVAAIDPAALQGIDAMDNLRLVKGNLVLFPTNFLRKEELVAHVLSAEYLLPMEIYT